MLTSSLGLGNVWHKRYTPKVHEFSYKLNSWLINIDDYQKLNQISRFIGINKFNLYTFDEKKYIRNHSGSLPQKVRQKFSELGANLEGNETIFLLGQLKNLGIYFSPINLYLCMLGDKCAYVLAEVSNTPWNERHYYLINLANKPYINAKNFHVSPFWTINQDYHWQFDIQVDKIYFQIDNYQDGKKVFSAGYQVTFTNLLKENNINRLLVKQPFNVWKILCVIYFEALKIFIKRIPFVPYQRRKDINNV